jgi:hypothetical protein
MIRLARVAEARSFHAALLTGSADIPLAKNFADEAHQDWVTP